MPEALQSPLQRRSQYLAEALKASRQPQNIQGWGELAARLLAQGITQTAANRTDEALSNEQSNETLRRRQAMFPGLLIEGEQREVGTGRFDPIASMVDAIRGGRAEPQAAPPPAAPPQAPQPSFVPTNTQQPQSSPIAPVGAVSGGPLPSPGPMQPQGPAASQAAIPPQIEQQITSLLAVGSPEAEDQALKIYQGWQQQQQILASIPAELRNDPKFMFAAQNNPEALAESLGYQYRPQVIAAGGVQSVIGEGNRVSAPQTIQFGDTLTRVDPLSPDPQIVATRGPTYAEQTQRIGAERPQAVTTGTGQDTRLIGPNGEVVSEFAGRETPRPQTPQVAEINGQIRALETDVFPTLDRQRGLLQSGDVITGPLAQERLTAARFAASAGNEQARRQVAATEEYIANAGRLRVGMAKSLGTNPSNADIQLLDIVTGGDISKSQDGLLATLDQGYALAERQRNGYQSQLSQYGPQGAASSGGPRVGQVEEGYRYIGGDPSQPSSWERVR